MNIPYTTNWLRMASSTQLDTNIDSTLDHHMKKEEVIANLQKKLQDHPEVYQQIALAESDSS